jgi:hypothetical protein
MVLEVPELEILHLKYTCIFFYKDSSRGARLLLEVTVLPLHQCPLFNMVVMGRVNAKRNGGNY